MWKLYFLLCILTLVLILDYIDKKEGLYLYDASENRLTANGIDLVTTRLFPNLNTKNNATLIQMFADISYCDNIDDLSYVEFNGAYVLRDDYNLYRTYEGFSDPYGELVELDYIEKIYLLMIGTFFILLLTMRRLL